MNIIDKLKKESLMFASDGIGRGIFKGVDMSTDAQIKTRLRLSEAVKLLEENPEAKIRHEGLGNDWMGIHQIEIRFIKDRYDVKLPPPKSVSVTRADCEAAYTRARKEYFSTQSELMNAFYKELGL